MKLAPMNLNKTIGLCQLGLLLLSSCCFGLGPADKPEGFTTLKIGDAAPDFALPATDGKTYRLADFGEPDVLLVIFTGTHCPVSNGAVGRVMQFTEDMKDESFGIVAINPNHNDGLRPDEFSYSKYTESFEDSKRYAEDHGWTFPFLYDGEKQLVARAYGCLATPHIFVFDKERKLRYKGRYDDSNSADPKTVKHPDAQNAVKALLAGKSVLVKETRPRGCSTKWRGRKAHVQEDERIWQAAPALVEKLDAKTVAALRKNGSGKIRLFNVWATWCQPCREELPILSALSRKFSRREFEVITISIDELSKKADAEKMLGQNRMVIAGKLAASVKAEGRKTNNYIFSGGNAEELAKALDPEWPGPVPYSLLVDADGKVLMRHSGVIAAADVSDIVLDKLGIVFGPKKVRKKKKPQVRADG